MRRAKEDSQWSRLKKARAGCERRMVSIPGGPSIDVSMPCTVVGGRNGTGKSRLLRAIEGELGQGALLIDLPHLCEQALIVLRSRDDFDDMAEEVGAMGPDETRLSDVCRVVGRDYDFVEWFALDVVLADDDVAAKFGWSGDQPLVPYFRVSHRGSVYSASDMGLGEFAAHFVFWILEQYRDSDDLVVLLDEPDAYLPPVGVSAFLARLLRICEERGWSMILTTHSEESISQAVEQGAFVLVEPGSTVEELALVHVSDDDSVADGLLSRPSIELVLFCEDESALSLTRALLERGLGRSSRSVSIVWGDGHGYMRALYRALPRSARPDISFGFLLDGDQRDDLPDEIEGRWPLLTLPTEQDPDELFRSLASYDNALAAKLDLDSTVLRRELRILEGEDAHDWVNQLSEKHGRQRVLGALADLWCEANPDLVAEFVSTLRNRRMV